MTYRSNRSDDAPSSLRRPAVELLVAAAASERYAEAVDAGHGEQDMAAVRRVT